MTRTAMNPILTGSTGRRPSAGPSMYSPSEVAQEDGFPAQGEHDAGRVGRPMTISGCVRFAGAGFRRRCRTRAAQHGGIGLRLSQ